MLTQVGSPSAMTESELGFHCFTAGPIDAVIYQSGNYHLLRQSTVSGSCKATGLLASPQLLSAGTKRIQFSVRECASFVYDAYTGWNSVSRILIEELTPRECPLPSVHSLM